ncbi:MAG: DinB family protein [Leptolyngbya sp.]|nr:DinB family protein [Candidatus Melainabacteria bacterium]
MITEPKLAKPGAGLPFAEWAVAKYIMLPRLLKNTDKDKALDSFAQESKQILTIVGQLSSENLSKRRLIPRLRGLEDSSRYWSVAMTLQHLVIVGDSMRQVILQLSSGIKPPKPVRTADVKPDSSLDIENILKDFEQMSEQFLKETAAADIEAFPQLMHAHPWFGPLNARQWLIFAAPHQKIHHKQIEVIIDRL